MFDIEGGTIKNFRSYRGEHTFEFPTAPGLYSLTGINNANPHLGSNGAGKSSLLDAIRWCFYGRTARGLKAGEIITWGEKTCEVTIRAALGQERPLIRRTQSPNSLTVDGKPVDQETLQKLLRLTPEAFDCAVTLPQFGTSFLDLKPEAKLTLFSQIMDLERWLERSKAADAEATNIAKQLTALEQELAHTEGRIESTQDSIKELSVTSANFEDQQDEKIKRLEAELLESTKSAKKVEAEARDLKKLLLGAENRAAELTTALQHALGKQLAAGNESNAALVKREIADNECAALWKKQEGLDKLGAECSVCLQPITKQHLAKAHSNLERDIEAAEEECLLREQELLEVQKRLKVANTTCDTARQDLRTAENNQRDFAVEQRKNTALLEATKSRITDLNDHIEGLVNEPNPYGKMLAEKQKLLRELKNNVAGIPATINKVTAEHAAAHYWVLGFKRVRLFIIEETLRQLEIEVNNALVSLGLTEWRITFDVERENKSGGVTRGFMVFIHPPGAVQPLRFETYSGGEVQRLRLAADLGLASLIMERAGYTSKIEFIDEPTAHISDAGLPDLAETLHQRAINSKKKVWLIDHRIINFGDFADELLVVRDVAGNSALNWRSEA